MQGINQKKKIRALEAALNQTKGPEEQSLPNPDTAPASLETPPQDTSLSQALTQSSLVCDISPSPTAIDIEDSPWGGGEMYMSIEPLDSISHNQTPLHLALVAGRDSMVRLLLEKGANPMKRDSNGLTALHFAAQSAQADMVRIILESFADLNARDATGQTALFYAARSGKEDIVKALLDASIDINCKDIWGKAVLHYVAENGLDSIAELLLQYGAEIDA